MSQEEIEQRTLGDLVHFTESLYEKNGWTETIAATLELFTAVVMSLNNVSSVTVNGGHREQ